MADTNNNQNQNDSQQQDQEEYNSFRYKFQQQIMDAWKPVPYTQNNVILYLILTLVCGILGIVLLLTNSKTPQIQVRYDDDSDGTGSFSINFTLSEDLLSPVYLYYGLSSYYQNHRRYLKYFSPDQMNGNQVDQKTAKSQCGDGAYLNSQMGVTLSITGATINSTGIAFPCGQRARSYLKIKPQIDSFKLKHSNGTYINLNRTGVAWPDDASSYKNSGTLSNQIIDNQDQAWLVWFRPAPKNKFFKLHSRIQENLPAGNYIFEANDLFDASFGEKLFFLGKSNYVGNRDFFLGIAFLALGGGCLVVLIVFIAKCVNERRGKQKQP